MSDIKLMVLYPFPTDVDKFEKDYLEHLALFHRKMNIPTDVRPYTITKIHSNAQSPSPYYHIFTMPFPSSEALDQVMSTPEMQEVAGDAARISSGGAPVILVGSDTDPLFLFSPELRRNEFIFVIA